MHRKQLYRRLKIGLIVFIAAISLLLMVSLPFDIYARKLYLQLFPRPTLSAEALENYWQNPLPPPKPILEIVTQAKSGKLFCIKISTTHLWMKGDEQTDIYSRVQKSFELYIDGAYNFVREITVEATAFSSEQDGSFGGAISACLDLPALSTGLHSAEVQFSDTHGRLYTHIWAFRITS